MRKPLIALLLPSLALLGCRPEETTEEDPVSQLIDGSAVVGLEIAPASGNVPLTTVARATNAWGAAVMSSPEEVVVGGSTQSVSFDGLGYGEVVLDSAGTAEVLGGDDAVMLHGFDSSWPGFGMQPGELPLGEGIFAQSVSGGAAVASATEVWWAGEGMPPHRVLAWPEGLITGMRSGNADSDGRLDLLVWGGDKVVVLRGRPGGGLAWATGFQSTGNAPVGAAAGDVNDDGVQDLVIAWAIPGGNGVLEVLEGDGIGGFTSRPVELADVPSDVAVGDGDGDGTLEITVIVGPTWARFTHSDLNDAYEATGPNLNSLNLPSGSRVVSGKDFNGDGADELVFIGPLQNGQDREIFLYDLVGQSNVTFLRLTPRGAEVAIGDGNLDGQADLFMLHETGELFNLIYDGNDATQHNTAVIGERGPLAMADYDGEDFPDVLVAGETWTWWFGTAFEGATGEQWWTEGEPLVGSWATSQDAIAQVEADGNASTVEIAGIGRSGGNTVLSVWQLTPGTAPTLAPYGTPVTLASPARNVEDMAACGTAVYALLDGELHAITLGGSAISTAATGTAVACGTGPSGATAATLAGDTITFWNAALTQLGTQTEAGAEDLALGVGSPDLAVCTSPGCGVAWWPLPSGGQWATTTNDGIDVGGTLLHGGGKLTVVDVDGDGNQDLLSRWEGGRVGVYRATATGYSPGEIFHMSRDLVGAPIAIDATGEGDADLLVLDDAGDLYITPTPGTAP